MWYVIDILVGVIKVVNLDILGNFVRKVNMFDNNLYYDFRIISELVMWKYIIYMNINLKGVIDIKDIFKFFLYFYIIFVRFVSIVK